MTSNPSIDGRNLLLRSLEANRKYQAILIERLRSVVELQASFSCSNSFKGDYFAGTYCKKPEKNSDIILKNSLKLPLSFAPVEWRPIEVKVTCASQAFTSIHDQ